MELRNLPPCIRQGERYGDRPGDRAGPGEGQQASRRGRRLRRPRGWHTASDRAASTPAVVSTSGTAPACDTTAVPALSVPTRGGRPLRFTPRCSSFNDLVASATAILVGWSTFQFDPARRQRESGGLG
jgi:hypothetical protein